MEILVGALAAWRLIMLVWTIVGLVLLPLSRDMPITVVLHGSGDAPWMERCLQGVLWLRDTGLLWWTVLILDEGLSYEGQDRAKRLAQDKNQILVMNLEELKEWMEAKHDGTAE